MKKILLTIILSLLILSNAAAISVTDAVSSTYAAVAEPYAPKSAMMLGMGSAGIAIPRRSDAFFVNPAALGAKRFELSIPYVQFTVYHPSDLLSSNDDFGSEIGKLFDLDAGLSFSVGGFAFGVFANTSLHTTNDPSLNRISEANAVVAFGYGHRFYLPMNFSIDVGAIIRFNYLGYSEAFYSGGINYGDFSNIFSGFDVMAGWSLPIDIGLNLNMPLGFSFGVVARNINGNYHMAIVSDFDELADDPFGNNSSNRFTLSSDFSLDVGIAWCWENAWFSPTIAFDLVDLIGLCTDPFDFNSFIYHLNAGVEFHILSFLDLRAGLSQGYLSVGLGLNLWVLRLDMAYYVKEFGEYAGENGIDGFTVRFNIGFDK